MCGRFTLTLPPNGLGDLFGIDWSLPFTPRFNIAPGQEITALRATEQGHEFTQLRWGLVPSWAKDEKIAWRTINARSETVATTPSFRAAFRARRCLIPADGYYEWQKNGKSKQPWHIHLADRTLFAFAGLWETWRGPEKRLSTCTLLTTAASPAVAAIHPRMPVIIAPASYHRWLDSALHDAAALQTLLADNPPGELVGSQVSALVNDARNEGPECLDPISP